MGETKAESIWWGYGAPQGTNTAGNKRGGKAALHAFSLTSEQLMGAKHGVVWVPPLCKRPRWKGVVTPVWPNEDPPQEGLCSSCEGIARPTRHDAEHARLEGELSQAEAEVARIRRELTRLRRGPTLSERLMAALDLMVAKEAAMLAQQVGHSNVASVRAILSMLIKEGRVVKHSRGGFIRVVRSHSK